MSLHFTVLISTDPEYVPETEALREATELFTAFVSPVAEVNVLVTTSVQFVDQGEHWERVSCPVCTTELAILWWQEAMDNAWCGEAFGSLETTVPCCGARVSLNDLSYEGPAGFARFQLKARDHDVYEISKEQIERLEIILKTELRLIWQHY